MAQQKSACLASINNICFEFSPQNPVSKSQVPGAYLYTPSRARDVETGGYLGFTSQLAWTNEQTPALNETTSKLRESVLLRNGTQGGSVFFTLDPVHPSKGKRREEEGLGCRQSFKGHIQSDRR